MHLVEIILSFFISIGDGHVQVVTYPFVFEKESSCESVAQKLEPVYLSNMSSNHVKVTHSCTVVKDIHVDVMDGDACVSCYRTAIPNGFESLKKDKGKKTETLE
ncbi:hypothetical protein V6259_19070 [Marinomonas sp. TI.3.20]|uniref:hypothetical protein n=1 Tax=Marinomonas sp. TI.3.20 TaxID=3121296 RepID=UPI00311FCBA8